MKTITRYISPLLICGLMFTFYHFTYSTAGKAVKICAEQANCRLAKKSLEEKLDKEGFSFFRNVVAPLFPALKSLF